MNLTGTCTLCGLLDCTTLHLGCTTGDTDQHTGAGFEETVLMHLADKVLQHLLGDIEVCDYAVFQWADRNDITGGTTQHALRFGTDRCNRFVATPLFTDGDYRGFIENNSLIAHINQCVSGSQIDREIVGKHSEQASKHLNSLLKK